MKSFLSLWVIVCGPVSIDKPEAKAHSKVQAWNPLESNPKGEFGLCAVTTLEGDLEVYFEGDLEGKSKGDFRGDFKQDLEGDLLSRSDQVQVWLSLQLKFNS